MKLGKWSADSVSVRSTEAKLIKGRNAAGMMTPESPPKDGKPNRGYWWALAIVFVPALITAWILFRIANPFQTEHDTTEQRKPSPDGAYTAVLLYRENQSMTYGYYHVRIEPRNERAKEVVEVAAEGLTNLEWVGPRNLIVHYTPSENGEKIKFVEQPSAWRDIKIDYHPDALPK